MLLCSRVLFSWITCVSASARQFAYGAVECTELLSASLSSQESLRRLPCVPVLVPVAPHDLIANRNAGLSNMPTGICGASSSTAPLAPSRPHSRKTCVSMRGRVVVPENPQLRICALWCRSRGALLRVSVRCHMGFQYRTKIPDSKVTRPSHLCGRRAQKPQCRPDCPPPIPWPATASTFVHEPAQHAFGRRREASPSRTPTAHGQPILAPCMARRCPSRSHSPTSHFSTTTACCGASSFPRCTIPFGLATRPCLQNGMSHLCAASKSAVLGWRRCGCRTRAARLARGVPRTSSPG